MRNCVAGSMAAFKARSPLMAFWCWNVNPFVGNAPTSCAPERPLMQPPKGAVGVNPWWLWPLCPMDVPAGRILLAARVLTWAADAGVIKRGVCITTCGACIGAIGVEGCIAVWGGWMGRGVTVRRWACAKGQSRHRAEIPRKRGVDRIGLAMLTPAYQTLPGPRRLLKRPRPGTARSAFAGCRACAINDGLSCRPRRLVLAQGELAPSAG